MTTTLELPRTAARSTQLVAASQRSTHDPFTEIDWDARPLDDHAYHLPPELLPLFGTAAWDAMGEDERMAYSRHETSALLGAGIWFENALMQIVLSHLLEIPVTDPMHRYLLVEVADECRHSTMFGEYIRRSGTPAYAPDRPVMIDESDGGRALSYLLVLAIEEYLDYANRLTMRDERVNDLSRQIAKLHVLEEARHVSFARSFLSEVWGQLDATAHEVVRDAAPVLVAEIVSLAVDPAVYDELGIADGADIARANPHHRANIVSGLSKLTTFLTDIGVIDDAHRPTWASFGLVA